MGRAIDLFVTYRFLKLLTTPFEKTEAFKLGIIDPLKVTRNALINAVSVATTILSTNAIVTHARVNQQK